MDYKSPHAILIVYITSNLVGLLFLIAAIKKPILVRGLFFLLFSWASWINYTSSHLHPEFYLMYAEKSIPIYSYFITTWFKYHITTFVSCIAIGQGLIAIGMLLKGIYVKLSCVASIIFLLGIAPLGLYAAFPFSLVVSAAAYFIYRKDNMNYLWKM